MGWLMGLTILACLFAFGLGRKVAVLVPRELLTVREVEAFLLDWTGEGRSW